MPFRALVNKFSYFTFPQGNLSGRVKEEDLFNLFKEKICSQS